MKELIVAAGLDGAIGKDNKLLWDLKDDLKHFFKVTKGKNVVMGSKTFDSLPNGPLKGRHNYVITHSTIGTFSYDDNTKLTFLAYDEFLQLNVNDYVVIGGNQIYELFKANVDIIWLTLVFGLFPEADTFIPEINASEWIPHVADFYPANERNEYPFHIVKMTKR